MDYNSVFKEKLGKMLFLEINEEGFKKSIGMPSYVNLKNRELYIPVSSEYITSNANNEIKMKNLPIYYFIEGMFFALGADKNLRFNDDYETILTYIKDAEICIKSMISKNIKDDKLVEAYLLLKGLYRYNKDLDVMKKLLLVGETIREKDSGFKEIILSDIDYCEEKLLKIPESYLYKTLILKDDGDFKAARVSINEYINLGGTVTEDIKIIINDINNISDYEQAIEYLKDDPAKSIEILLGLLEKFEDNPLIYYYLGVAYRKLENYEKAIYYLTESISKESGILEVVVELGVNYACINDFEAAIKYFKKAFEATKEVEICTNIVMCYMNLNKFEEAKLHLDIAEKLNPEDEIVKELATILKKKS
ncbi:tetratricopeptide repeat protein [Clostridium septicum]|uniref:Tetratricopeptide repeat protein n=1 Tax=Clostridium septicum TaxID=1504 RepID=A0ABY5B6F0_CLOSE|nr:tetratricopeptide repeat protein [Clostridium septicum]MDU1314996.1 tetratricopeptide repeat protein [Clostridium septicum]UEC19763.1 tetratricopeptide repeat protein [Clostridium septicum]USS02177.1 tetratricopeptide repeat protein [Clostridium septicum]